MAVCEFCKQEMTAGVTCTFDFHQEAGAPRIPHPANAKERCHDCFTRLVGCTTMAATMRSARSVISRQPFVVACSSLDVPTDAVGRQTPHSKGHK